MVLVLTLKRCAKAIFEVLALCIMALESLSTPALIIFKIWNLSKPPFAGELNGFTLLLLFGCPYHH
jgi:hypothetical protein